jgi:RNA polymerase sigma factor (sigma-70 family)
MEQEKLVEGLKAGEERAWRCFVERYGKLIHAVAVRFGFDPAEADDHFQGVCLTVLRSIDGLRESHHLVSWLYKIAYRSAVDIKRRRRAGVPVDELAESGSPALQVEPTIIEEMQSLQVAAQLMDSLDELDRQCRRLLELLFLAEPRPSYTEISRSEGLPLGSIGPNRARCLEKLLKIFKRLSNHDPDASALSDPDLAGDAPRDPQED